MDDFLREIQTSLFREWINNQKKDYYHLHQSETDPDAIIIENEYSKHLNMPFLCLKKWINVLKK